MTRARTALYGVVTPPPLHRWMHAVLMLCVSLVQGAASTLKMIFVPRARECHTKAMHDDLPSATSSLFGPPAPRPAVDAQRRVRAVQPILRDDRFAIPQDEAGRRSSKESRCPHKHKTIEALMLRDLRLAQIVSKQFDVACAAGELVRGTNSNIGRGLTALSTEACKARAPRAGGDPDLRVAQTHIHQSALTRADQTLALILSLSKDAGDRIARSLRLKSA